MFGKRVLAVFITVVLMVTSVATVYNAGATGNRSASGGDVASDGSVATDGNIATDGNVATDGDIETGGGVATDGDIEGSIDGTIGYLTYSILNGAVTITGCDTAASGVVEIPDTIEGYPVEIIGDYAFYDCIIDKLILPNTIKRIGNGAFWGFKFHETEITLPENLESIGVQAFAHTDIQSLRLPATVCDVKGNSFINMGDLCTIWVDENNANYSSDENGVLFNKDKTELIFCPVGQIDQSSLADGRYYIPDDVVKLGTYCFFESEFSDIIIPESVTQIADSSFSACGNLSSIVIPSNVKFISFGAFCVTPITEITFEHTAGDELSLDLGYGTFNFYVEGFPLVIYVPDLDNIHPTISGYQWKRDYRTVIYMEIPSEDSDTTRGIYDCLTFTVENGEVTITGCDANASGVLEIPETIIGYPVTTIADSALNGCVNVTEVSIPKSVTSIEGRLNFSTMLNLTAIWVDEDNPNYSSDEYGVLYNKDKTKLIKYPEGRTGAYVVPDGVTEIGEEAFLHPTAKGKLTEITLPDSLITIGPCAFTGCSNLSNVVIPSSVTLIEIAAFSTTPSITEFTFEHTAEDELVIGTSVFDVAENMETVIYVPDVDNIHPAISGYDWAADNRTVTYWDTTKGLYGWLTFTIENDEVTITNCDTEASGVIEIPETIMGYPVTTIAEKAFYERTQITEVVLPDTLTEIGCYAFAYSGLVSVSIPSQITVIREGTFSHCTDLKTVTFTEGLLDIENDAFAECTSLTELKLPSTCSEKNIGNIVSPGSNVAITVGGSGYSNDNGVIYNNDKSEIISVSTTVTKYGIPDSVTHIGEGAFKESGITELTFEHTVDSELVIDDGAFHWEGDTPRALTIYVPDPDHKHPAIEGYKWSNHNAAVTWKKSPDSSYVNEKIDVAGENGENVDITAKDLYKSNAELAAQLEDGIDKEKAAGTIKALYEVKADFSEGESTSITLIFKVAGIKATDKVTIVHWLTDSDGNTTGEVEYITPDAVRDGEVEVTFTSLSPIAIVSEAVAQQVEVTVNNIGAENSGAIVTAPENGWYERTNTFTVSCEMPCTVAVSYNGGVTYTRLTASAADAGYSFTVNDVKEGTVIVVMVSGDVNGDGQLATSDLVKLKAALMGKTDLDTLGAMAADVNRSGDISNPDLVKLRAVLLGKTTLSW